jgi:Rho GDP-dissociation inhibitor
VTSNVCASINHNNKTNTNDKTTTTTLYLVKMSKFRGESTASEAEGEDNFGDLVSVEAPKKDKAVYGRASIRDIKSLLEKDAEDASLVKYKESLLGAAAHGDVGDSTDPRRMYVTEFAVIFAPEEGRPEIVHKLDTDQGIAKLTAEGIKMKEGCKFKFRVSFRVNHDILAGMKFTNTVSTTLMNDEETLMIGTYPPAATPHTFEFPRFGYNEAPAGMLFRGKYKVKNAFRDSDAVKYLEFGYELTIAKTW